MEALLETQPTDLFARRPSRGTRRCTSGSWAATDTEADARLGSGDGLRLPYLGGGGGGEILGW